MGKLKQLEQWLADFRWAMNAMRARRWRREMLFSQRMKFDDELRPKVDEGRIAYPDALYHISVDDLLHALQKAYATPPKETE